MFLILLFVSICNSFGSNFSFYIFIQAAYLFLQLFYCKNRDLRICFQCCFYYFNMNSCMFVSNEHWLF